MAISIRALLDRLAAGRPANMKDLIALRAEARREVVAARAAWSKCQAADSKSQRLANAWSVCVKKLARMEKVIAAHRHAKSLCRATDYDLYRELLHRHIDLGADVSDGIDRLFVVAAADRAQQAFTERLRQRYGLVLAPRARPL